MIFVINIAKTDSNGQVVERQKIGEYKTEIDAIMKVSEEDQKLKKAGIKDAHVEMLQILEK